MRMTVYTPVVILCLLMGCNKNDELEKQNTDLQNQNAVLVRDLTARDEYIDTVTQAINDVTTSLELTDSKQQELLKESGNVESLKKHTGRELRGKILQQIASIDSNLLRNRRRLKELEARIKSYHTQFAGLNKMIASLESTLNDREQSMAQLERKVKGLETEIAEKTELVAKRDSVITSQSTTIAQQRTRINTAYFIMGKRDELEKKGIIAKQGGFLWGLLGSTTLLANGFDPAYFQPIDRTIDTTITVSGGIDEIVPKREERFYNQTRISDKQSALKIVEPKSFWQDDYLVIITD